MTPRHHFTDSLLGALGARDEIREPLLGDLAEEFELRAARDGYRAARRWRYRESMRAVPYLLYDWARGLGFAGLRRTGGVVLAAYFFTAMLAFFAMHFVIGVTTALGITVRADFVRHASPLALIGLLTANIALAVVAGFIAAWLDREAPLASALSLGVICCASHIVATTLVAMGGGVVGPSWYRIAAPCVILAGPVLGGVLHARRIRGSDDEIHAAAAR